MLPNNAHKSLASFHRKNARQFKFITIQLMNRNSRKKNRIELKKIKLCDQQSHFRRNFSKNPTAKIIPFTLQNSKLVLKVSIDILSHTKILVNHPTYVSKS